MDEPTSSLTLAETDRLLRVIADLKASGVSVIFISHRLDEVTACADRVVVLRDGRLVGRLAKGEISPAAMIRLMIGRDLKVDLPAAGGAAGRAASSRSPASRTATYPDARGRSRGAAGRDPRPRRADRRRPHRARPRRLRHRPAARRDASGSTASRSPIASPRDAIARGIYLVPEDRKAQRRRARPADRREHRAAAAPAPGPRAAWSTASAEEKLARGRAAAARHPRAQRGDAGDLALGRQPAEGRARQVARDAAAGDHLRRADPRHRRRRQARDLRPDARRSPTPASRS